MLWISWSFFLSNEDHKWASILLVTNVGSVNTPTANLFEQSTDYSKGQFLCFRLFTWLLKGSAGRLDHCLIHRGQYAVIKSATTMATKRCIHGKFHRKPLRKSSFNFHCINCKQATASSWLSCPLTEKIVVIVDIQNITKKQAQTKLARA